jgi:hypothetical protein
MRVCIVLILLSVYFCHYRESQVEYNIYALIKVDWLAACIALRVVGDVFVIFSPNMQHLGIQSAQSSSQWEARADTFPQPADQ